MDCRGLISFCLKLEAVVLIKINVSKKAVTKRKELLSYLEISWKYPWKN